MSAYAAAAGWTAAEPPQEGVWREARCGMRSAGLAARKCVCTQGAASVPLPVKGRGHTNGSSLSSAAEVIDSGGLTHLRAEHKTRRCRAPSHAAASVALPMSTDVKIRARLITCLVFTTITGFSWNGECAILIRGVN